MVTSCGCKVDSTELKGLEGLAVLDEGAYRVKLSDKQALYVQEYLIDVDNVKTCLRVGISQETGNAWLKNPIVASRIRVAMAQRLSRTRMTQDQVLLEMSLLSHSRVNHYQIDEDGAVTLAPDAPAGAMAAVQSIKRRTTSKTDPRTNEVTKDVVVEIKLWDKPTPLRLMGKHVGLFPDRMEHSGPNGGPIEVVDKIERLIIDADVVNDQETPERAV